MGMRALIAGLGCLLATACMGGGGGGGTAGAAATAGTPVAGLPAAGTPAATPAAGAPAAGAPAAGAPVAGAPMAGTPAAGAPMAGAQMAGEGTGGTPVAGEGTGGTPMAGDGTGGTPMAGGTPSEPTEVEMCIQMATEMGRTGECPVCGCTNCLPELMDCQDDACRSVTDCGQDNGCVGTACYCGAADAITCLSAPAGPCMDEIVTASGLLGTANCMTVDSCALGLVDLETSDPTNAVVRASTVSLCSTGQDADPGVPPFVPATEEVIGACEAECTPM